MTDPSSAYSEVEKLVRRFKALSGAERKAMNENATRQGYILPLFRALGWTIDNVDEVSPEEKVSRGFVDFAFRLGGIPRFFLETKKTAEDLNDPRWVQQAIDYAWTKSVTWALLSDFEGLRVFNAEWRETDPFRAQFLEFDLDSYLTDFERLWWLSRAETAAGRLDREADKVGKRIKRLPVSVHLFDDLKGWRAELYKSLRGYNPLYSPAQIDEAVLRLLNRLIFIRTAEDRQVEPPRLLPLLRELEGQRRLDRLWERLNALFRDFDAVYNSELFAPHFSEELYCDRMPLENLIRGLYEKNFVRYNFNALDADVLGTVYEQYLGHIVTETQSETGAQAAAAHVEEKRAKRKSQGIYYTPAFVTRYIVQQTVGRWLEEHGYDPSRPPRILDMACGSGSFLIEAFETLDRFVARQRGQAHGGEETFHDFARRMELLTNCIFGVDKDKQAVDVARLNLLLRALHTHGKLPLLTNIVEGDSLRPETFTPLAPPDPTRPFGTPSPSPADLGRAGEGSFDIIIGNPPYVRQEALGEDFKAFARQNFETYAGTADLYIYFIEKAHKLLKPGGYFGMIVSNKWMRSNYGKPLRDFLTRNAEILEIVDFGELPVFQDAATFPAIVITRRRSVQKQRFLYAPIKRLDFPSLPEEVQAVGSTLDERALQGENWTLSRDREQDILEKMRQNGIPLGEFVGGKILYGIKTGYNDAFIVDGATRNRLIAEHSSSDEIIKPFVMGDDVRKYHINWNDRHIILTLRGITIQKYPAIAMYLAKFKERLIPKPKDWKGNNWSGRKPGNYEWYEIQDTVEYHELFEKPKIIYPVIAREPRFTLDRQGFFSNDKTFIIPTDDPYLLAILNSKIAWLFLKRTCSVLGDPDKGGRLELRDIHIKQLPIRRLDLTSPAEKAAHDEIVRLVEEMLDLQKKRQQAEAALDDSRFTLQKRIEALDREIDARVYRLYGLTEEEIRIVEGG